MATPKCTPRPDGEATDQFAADQLADLTSAPQTVRRVCFRIKGGGGVFAMIVISHDRKNICVGIGKVFSPDSPKDFTWLYRSSRLSECKCFGLKLNKLGKMFSTCLRIWIPTLWRLKMRADPTQLDLDSGAKMFNNCFHVISNNSGQWFFYVVSSVFDVHLYFGGKKDEPRWASMFEMDETTSLFSRKMCPENLQCLGSTRGIRIEGWYNWRRHLEDIKGVCNPASPNTPKKSRISMYIELSQHYKMI